MTRHRRSPRLSLCLVACTLLLSAETYTSKTTPDAAQTATTQAAADTSSSWLDIVWSLPIFNWFAPQAVEPLTPSLTAEVPPAPPLPPCAIAPLPPITDAQAAAFNSGESLDTADLTHGMSGALARFKKIVSAVGGSLELKSAYRPPAYQEHLQQVWDKWMLLRDNNDASCQDLRADVHAEFLRHHLLETQRPVTSSDHTRGMAFDATVVLPPNARLKRRKATLDFLAHIAGLRRPDIRHDPVHYKYVGGLGKTRRA